MTAVDLYWLPLGAGGHSVRLNGRVFEAVAARLGRRPPCDLYHSALEVRVPEGRFVIEMAPVPDGNGDERGVVAEGAVGSRRAGALADLPLRGAPLARRDHPGRRRSGREPAAAVGRSGAGTACARPRSSRSHAGVGPRRARRGRDVELELADLLADRALRASARDRPPTRRWARAGLGSRARGRASPGRDVTACGASGDLPTLRRRCRSTSSCA